MRKSLSTVVLILAVICSALAQDLPNTNIYLFDIEKKNDSTFLFQNGKFLTDFNKDGYNNQPFFFSDTELYITVGFPAEGQTDIYSLNLQNNTKLQVTRTAESEYSPTIMPDKSDFSAIRVELDANNSQRLWSFPVSRKDNGQPVFPNTIGVGYHYWLDNYRLALFMVDAVNYLAVGDIRDGKLEELTTNIGRTFKKSPAGNLAYVHKTSETTWFIKEMDKETLRSRVIAPTLAGSEDFAVLPDGTVIMGRGSKIYKYHPKKDNEWLEIADLRFYNINSITRLAVNSVGQIAIVGS